MSAAEARHLATATVRRYLADGMIDRAPGIAYYGILSVFPLLLIASAVVRLFAGADAPVDLAAYAREQGASGPLADAVRTAAETARSSSTPTAGAAGLAGLLTLVYGGSRAFTAAGRALDAIAHESSVNRSLLRRLQDIGWTLVVLLLVLALGVLAFAGGQALEQVLHLFGVQELSVWRFLRWPAAILAALLIVTVVRWAAPTGSRPRFSLLGPGVALTVGVLLVETVGFDIYVSEFSSYNTTYGAFAGGVILLLWIWLAAIAFLLGAELDAVMHTPPAEAGTRACPPPTLRRESRQGKRPTRST